MTLGEATAVTAEYRSSDAMRALVRIGMQHTAEPFSPTLDDVMIGVGIERDLFALNASTTLTAGLGFDAWARRHYLRLRPMLALEMPIGVRIASPESAIAWRLAIVPRYGVLPGLHPHVGGFIGFAFQLPEAGKRKSPPAAQEETAAEKAAAEVDAKAKTKAQTKTKKAKQRRRKKR
jgi:hypothetical protein